MVEDEAIALFEAHMTEEQAKIFRGLHLNMKYAIMAQDVELFYDNLITGVYSSDMSFVLEAGLLPTTVVAVDAWSNRKRKFAMVLGLGGIGALAAIATCSAWWCSLQQRRTQ